MSEPQRLALHRAARAALGDEEGDTLMALSPPANTDIATKQDVEHSTSLLGAQMGERLAEMSAEISAARAATSVDVAELAARIERTANVTMRWTVGTMLAGNAGVIAILGLLLR